jgi:hypothetical protein
MTIVVRRFECNSVRRIAFEGISYSDGNPRANPYSFKPSASGSTFFRHMFILGMGNHRVPAKAIALLSRERFSRRQGQAVSTDLNSRTALQCLRIRFHRQVNLGRSN